MPINLKKFSQKCIIKDEHIFEKYKFKIIQRRVSTHAAARDALAERLQSIRDTAFLLYDRMMENMGYGQQERLKDIV